MLGSRNRSLPARATVTNLPISQTFGSSLNLPPSQSEWNTSSRPSALLRQRPWTCKCHRDFLRRKQHQGFARAGEDRPPAAARCLRSSSTHITWCSTWSSSDLCCVSSQKKMSAEEDEVAVAEEEEEVSIMHAYCLLDRTGSIAWIVKRRFGLLSLIHNLIAINRTPCKQWFVCHFSW